MYKAAQNQSSTTCPQTRVPPCCVMPVSAVFMNSHPPYSPQTQASTTPGSRSQDLQSVSERLDFTALALVSKEMEVEMQAKEIEMLRKRNDELSKKTAELTAETQNAYFSLDWKIQIGQKQSQEIENLRRKCYNAQRENEEWKSKYQSALRATQQDTYSMEQFENALKNVLLNNDQIIENLKGIQTDPDEKKKLLVGHNETLRLIRESERLSLRVQELEERLRENGDTEQFDFDFCEDSFG
ncbi:unnamed protein product [Caenorhabditis brenneri]